MKDINKNLARNMKALRSTKGWSLDKLAKETGISKAMLGQIEREESSPTITCLWKLASGLQTSLSYLLENHSKKAPKKLSSTHNASLIKDDKVRAATLFPYDEQLQCEMFFIELFPGCEHLSAPHKLGTIEHVIVLQGQMEVLIDGKWQALSQGDGVRFNADKPHGYRNASQITSSFHNIIHYSR